jgi:hypothetical protein
LPALARALAAAEPGRAGAEPPGRGGSLLRRLGAAFAGQMLAGTFEASVAGADDALARAALGAAPPARDAFGEAGAVCPPLLLLPRQEVVRLLLAPTPEVALARHWPSAWSSQGGSISADRGGPALVAMGD